MYNTSIILKGELALDGDKSISHRLLMIGSIINDESTILNLSRCKDVQTTINCLTNCNISIEPLFMKNGYKIKGGNLKNPSSMLDCENSGSTARMLIGLLAGQEIKASFTGDESLLNRPMKRIIEPLKSMGVNFKSDKNSLPLQIDPKIQKSLDYKIETKSAQVKSALIFASLGCKDYSYISYHINTRDHTEKLLEHVNCDLQIKEQIRIKKTKINKGFYVQVPGDISNAAFLIAAVVIIPGSKIKINNVLFNKTRLGFIDLISQMGAKIKISNIDNTHYESMCSIEAEFCPNLRAVTIDENNIIQLIDEIPILCILATQAKGTTIIADAEELRYKESDRINAIYTNLKQMGADIIRSDAGVSIKGRRILYDASIDSFNDHRIAMSFEILKLLITGHVSRNFENIINISFPDFYPTIDFLSR